MPWTGRSDAHQVKVPGPLRRWRPGTLVCMPAATAHSKPDERLERDPAPSLPRWFARVNLRVAAAGRRARTEAGREERLALALLVAEHVWEDTAFVAAATEVAEAPAGVRAWWRRGNRAGEDGDKSGSGRHG